MYRVHPSMLAEKGVNFTSVHPANFHIYYRGIEQRYYLNNGSNLSMFDNDDFIEFYGLRNTGIHDTSLYLNSGYSTNHRVMPHPNLSLFTDTSCYWLTWNNEAGLKFTDYYDQNYDSYPKILGYKNLVTKNFPNYYISSLGDYSQAADIFYADFVPGEGYSIYFSRSMSLYLNSSDLCKPCSDSAIMSLTTFGGKIQVEVGDQNFEVNHDNKKISKDTIYIVNPNNLLEDSTLFQLTTPENYNQYLSEISLSYSRYFKFEGGKQLAFKLNDISPGFYSINIQNQNLMNQGDGYLYDISSGLRIKLDTGNYSYKAALPISNKHHTYCFVNAGSVKFPQVNQSNLGEVNFNLNSEYIIVTNKKLSASAENYANFRSSDFSVGVFYIDEIIDAFGYGIYSPLVVQNFVSYLYSSQSAKPTNFLFWGKGDFTFEGYDEGQDSIGLKFVYRKDYNMVPTYGYPASDLIFLRKGISLTVFFRGAIGRVSILQNEDGEVYLNKVQEYENAPKEPWMRKAIELSAGEDSAQTIYFSGLLDNSINDFITKSARFDTTFKYKYLVNSGNQDDYLKEVQKVDSIISDGVSIVYYFGHAAPGWFQAYLNPDWNYTNKGKSFIAFIVGCSSADFDHFKHSTGEKSILKIDGGAVAYFGFSEEAYPESAHTILKNFQTLLNNNLGSISLGELYRNIPDANDKFLYYHHLMFVLLGDPAIKPNLATLLDLEPAPTGFQPDSSKKKSVYIYPNPASNFVQIFSKEHLPEDSNILIYNQQGIEVYNRKVIEGNKISVIEWPKGFYLVKIMTSDGTYTGKLLVE